MSSRSQISICLTNCRYESIRKVASAFGMREVSEDDAWNFYWTDMSVSVERAKEMKRFQRINHYPGMLEICRYLPPFAALWTERLAVNLSEIDVKRFRRDNRRPVGNSTTLHIIAQVISSFWQAIPENIVTKNLLVWEPFSKETTK